MIAPGILFVQGTDLHIAAHQSETAVIDNNAFGSDSYDVDDPSAIVGDLGVNDDGSLSPGSVCLDAASDGTHVGAWQGDP